MAEKAQNKQRDDLFDYLHWRGDLYMWQSPFSEVDNLLLSVACYLDFAGIVPENFESSVTFREATDTFCRKPPSEQMRGSLLPMEIPKLARQTALSKRFAGTRVTGFINRIDEQKQMQFCAMTFLLPDDTIFVAYRGTDDTIVGWKEDFMLAFMTPVPAQRSAMLYLNYVANLYPNKRIRVGGHSKGGNLAIYAAIYALPHVQERLEMAYSNDGPGFMPEVLREPGYLAVQDRLMNYVPQSSIVGVLLHHAGKFQIIRSTQKALLQHDPFSWVIAGPRFVYEKSRSSFGAKADATLDRFLDSLTRAQRKRFIDNLFRMISASGAKTLTDILRDKLRSARVIIGTFGKLEREDREMMWRIMHQLLRASRESGRIEDEQKEAARAIERDIRKENTKKAKERQKALTESKKQQKITPAKAETQKKATKSKPTKKPAKADNKKAPKA